MPPTIGLLCHSSHQWPPELELASFPLLHPRHCVRTMQPHMVLPKPSFDRVSSSQVNEYIYGYTAPTCNSAKLRQQHGAIEVPPDLNHGRRHLE
ncbi:hypothetical protein GUJ93_ZPchr0007g3294 [Zizania palustris]|uniref:Uncharacterized protein n=1 Tax=Zizania palustris TaxID=103762 RepID=A0A8J5SVR3_ZIZPA|nr:hypothetical protein GUJ93_ZPchr0007g3294 [Zizania palustris]